MVELLDQAWRTARKSHCCNSCGGGIAPGERYSVSTCVDGGDLYQYKAHERCISAVDIIAGELPLDDDMPNVSDLESEDWEFIREESPDTYAAFMSRTSGDGPDMDKTDRETQA
jgi:predicted RNA-binding Zn-ribbon protein involved in translation (DUF1610 family)